MKMIISCHKFQRKAMNEKSKEYYSKLLYSRSIENPHRYQDLSQNYYSFVSSQVLTQDLFFHIHLLINDNHIYLLCYLSKMNQVEPIPKPWQIDWVDFLNYNSPLLLFLLFFVKLIIYILFFLLIMHSVLMKIHYIIYML